MPDVVGKEVYFEHRRWHWEMVSLLGTAYIKTCCKGWASVLT